MERKRIVLILLCSLIVLIDASKCPEPRKPHVTSCTIFYNCINLPEGGYVWAPSKCAQGLVFQPYLRICVLPGDTWTCDTLATESSLVIDHYERPELIDPSQTSYLGYTQVSSPLTDRPAIDASYPIDGISELGNLRPVATPYPLIEVVDTSEKNVNIENNESNEKNTGFQHGIGHQEENYLYQFFNSQQQLRPGPESSISNKGPDNHFTWLKGFINKMLLYKNVAEPLKQQVFSRDPVITRFTSTTCEPAIDTLLNKGEYVDSINSDILGYLVQSYILGTRQTSVGKTRKRGKKRTKTTTQSNESSEDPIDFAETTTVERPIDSFINGPKADDNVVVIRNNFIGKEYITVTKYKSLSGQTKLEVIGILPCAKGIRLPNTTDCTKYYTCDPETAAVTEFSCSSKTAFNDYSRICETQRYKTCVKHRDEESVVKKSTTIRTIESTSAPSRSKVSISDQSCQTTGKFADSMSDKHYYVCYSSQGNSGRIESLRMTCPNDLIFCQERKVCTNRKRCYE